MTEVEWLACTDPKPMLEFLRGKASDRELLLWADACWRRVESRLSGYVRSKVQQQRGVSRALVEAGTLTGLEAASAVLPLFKGMPVIPCELLHCVFGNPFRPSPPLPSAVLAWNDRTIPRIAQAIYDDRKLPEGTLDSARLGILADALLDAGCDDEELLTHCRSEGPHVRGCWGIDAILGKS